MVDFCHLVIFCALSDDFIIEFKMAGKCFVKISFVWIFEEGKIFDNKSNLHVGKWRLSLRENLLMRKLASGEILQK